MHCSSCGIELAEDAAFCHKCGASQSAKRPEMTDKFRDKVSDKIGDDEEEEDEEELWEGGFSGRAMVGSWLLAGVASVLILGGALMLSFTGIALLVAFVLIVLIWGFLAGKLLYRKWSEHYQLTNQRFIHKSGILKQITDRIELIDVDDVTIQQDIVQRMLGVGTVQISSSDRTHPELWMHGIADAKSVADMIDDSRRKERRRRGLHIESI